MSKEKITVDYPFEYVENVVGKLVRASHRALMNEEIKYKKKHGELYDTFGQWKKQNPNNPTAKMNCPDNEYLQVISAYRAYFDSRLSFDDELDL